MTSTKISPPKVGSRWKLTRDVERFPHFIAPEGAEGTITNSDESLIALKMDDRLDGAEDWDNEVCWEEDPARFAEDTEKATIRKVGKLLKTTWMDQAGSTQAFHLDSREDGHRIVVHRWFEDGKQGKAGEVTVRRIFGSGWRPKPGRELVEHSKVALQDPTDAEVIAAVKQAVKEAE